MTRKIFYSLALSLSCLRLLPPISFIVSPHFSFVRSIVVPLLVLLECPRRENSSLVSCSSIPLSLCHLLYFLHYPFPVPLFLHPVVIPLPYFPAKTEDNLRAFPVSRNGASEFSRVSKNCLLSICWWYCLLLMKTSKFIISGMFLIWLLVFGGGFEIYWKFVEVWCREEPGRCGRWVLSNACVNVSRQRHSTVWIVKNALFFFTSRLYELILSRD